MIYAGVDNIYICNKIHADTNYGRTYVLIKTIDRSIRGKI